MKIFNRFSKLSKLQTLVSASLLACMVVASPLPSFAGFDEGMKAFREKDYATAFKEWLPLAEEGNVDAMNNVGYLYRKGLGVESDLEKAMDFFSRSAKRGSAVGQFNLGQIIYKTSVDITQLKKARMWFSRSGKQGHARSQLNLGLMLYKGEGGKKDFGAAHFWFSLASGSLKGHAIKARDKLEKRMTPKQLARSKKLSKDWFQRQIKLKSKRIESGG